MCAVKNAYGVIGTQWLRHETGYTIAEKTLFGGTWSFQDDVVSSKANGLFGGLGQPTPRPLPIYKPREMTIYCRLDCTNSALKFLPNPYFDLSKSLAWDSDVSFQGLAKFMEALGSRCDFTVNDILSRTVSSIVGSFWRDHKQLYVQDRVHPKSGLLTMGEVLDFYTNEDGTFDSIQFTTMKDIVNNCSIMMSRGVKNFHKREQPQQRRFNARGPKSSDDTSNLLSTLEAMVANMETKATEREAAMLTRVEQLTTKIGSTMVASIEQAAAKREATLLAIIDAQGKELRDLKKMITQMTKRQQAAMATMIS